MAPDRDDSWRFYGTNTKIIAKTKNVQCKTCGDWVIAKAERLRKHRLKYHTTKPPATPWERGVESENGPSPKRQHFDRMTENERETIDELLATAIHATGYPFSFLDNMHWRAVFSRLNSAYKLPSRHNIGGKLLDSVYDKTRTRVLNEIKKWNSICFSMDGATNVNGSQVLNIMACSPHGLFLKHVNLNLERESAANLLQVIKQAKHELGCSLGYTDESIANWEKKTLFSFVSDSPNVMSKLRRSLVSSRECTFAIGCAPHALNNLALDVLKAEIPLAVIKQCVSIVKHIRNSHRISCLFAELCKKHCSKELKLFLFTKTRWSSAYVMLQRLERVKPALVYLAAGAAMSDIELDQDVVATLNQPQFWSNVSCIASLLDPISKTLKYLEGEDVTISAVYASFIYIKVEYTNMMALDQTLKYKNDDGEWSGTQLAEIVCPLISCLQKRFSSIYSEFHALAFATDPLYFDLPSLLESKYTLDFIHLGRESLHKQYKKALKAIDTMLCLEMANFTHSYQHDMDFMDDLPPVTSHPSAWWKCLTDEFPKLSELMIQLHRTPCGAAGGERNHKTSKMVHSSKRSCLNSLKVDKQVAIAFNLGQMNRKIREDRDSAFVIMIRNAIEGSSHSTTNLQQGAEDEDLEELEDDPESFEFIDNAIDVAVQYAASFE